MARILWVQDEYNGPLNGLLEYDGEKLWFTRDDVEIDSEKHYATERSETYTMHRLDSVLLEIVTNNHTKYCEETGAPLNHGDPIRLRRRDKSGNTHNVSKYEHSIIPSLITGDMIGKITEAQIINYKVPHNI